MHGSWTQQSVHKLFSLVLMALLALADTMSLGLGLLLSLLWPLFFDLGTENLSIIMSPRPPQIVVRRNACLPLVLIAPHISAFALCLNLLPQIKLDGLVLWAGAPSCCSTATGAFSTPTHVTATASSPPTNICRGIISTAPTSNSAADDNAGTASTSHAATCCGAPATAITGPTAADAVSTTASAPANNAAATAGALRSQSVAGSGKALWRRCFGAALLHQWPFTRDMLWQQ